MNQIQAHIPPQYVERAIKFFDHYSIKKVIDCSMDNRAILKRPSQRICRFCGLAYGAGSFKSDAHLISSFLGNKNMFSDFECDNCNSLFSRYESNLDNFIGPLRMFWETKEIKLKSSDKKAVIKNINFYNEPNFKSISRDDTSDSTFEFNRDAGKTTVKLVKHSYIPILVYKSILKFALSCLDEKEIEDYKLAIKLLLSNDLHVNGAPNILIYSLPIAQGYHTPFALIYQKVIPNENLCTHVFALSFMNYVYQIVIPLNRNDLRFYNTNIDVLYGVPMFSDKEVADTIQISEFALDMARTDTVKAEEQVFSFEYDKEQYKNLVSYNPTTKTISKIESPDVDIARIIFGNSNINLPLKDE